MGWKLILSNWDALLHGALLTVEVSVLSFVLAFLLGVVVAEGRRSRLRSLRGAATTFVEVTRNTPVLLQIFVAYFALPSIGLPLSSFQAGIIALSVNAAAYLAEILRAGIDAVPRGQGEAASVLGLSRWPTFRDVVMPQALRNVYPAVVNQFVQLILGTSLLSSIALPELTGTAMTINSETLLTMQVFAVALLIYLVLTNLVSFAASGLARVIFHPPLQVTPRPRRRLAVLGMLSRGGAQ